MNKPKKKTNTLTHTNKTQFQAKNTLQLKNVIFLKL